MNTETAYAIAAYVKKLGKHRDEELTLGAVVAFLTRFIPAWLPHDDFATACGLRSLRHEQLIKCQPECSCACHFCFKEACVVCRAVEERPVRRPFDSCEGSGYPPRVDAPPGKPPTCDICHKTPGLDRTGCFLDHRPNLVVLAGRWPAVRSLRRAKNGSVVMIQDGHRIGASGLRWKLRCMTHDRRSDGGQWAPTYRAASRPAEWCDGCRADAVFSPPASKK